jgi:acyl carrier protein
MNVEKTIHNMIAENAINPAVTSQDIYNNLGLDSVFDQIGFIEDFEDEFNTVLTEDRLSQFKTVGDLVRWVEQELT